MLRGRNLWVTKIPFIGDRDEPFQLRNIADSHLHGFTRQHLSALPTGLSQHSSVDSLHTVGRV